MEVKSNCFCLEAVSGNEFGDTQLRCGCLVHHDCLVQYVKSHLGDRLSLFSSAHKHDEIEMLRCAIFCPYTFAGSCKGSKQSNSMSVLSIRTSSSLELAIQDQIIESVKTDAVNFISVQELDFLVNFEEKHSNNFAHRLQMSDVDKVRRWAKESTTTTPISKSATSLYADDIKTEAYVKATTKACPSCQTRGTHYHGHHCHHISPSNGCMGCGTNYCYRCLSTEKDNLLATGESFRCLCGSWTNFCSTENIQRYTVAEPYPHDSRCGCAFCPDCSPSKPCNYCDGRCVVCCGALLSSPLFSSHPSALPFIPVTNHSPFHRISAARPEGTLVEGGDETSRSDSGREMLRGCPAAGRLPTGRRAGGREAAPLRAGSDSRRRALPQNRRWSRSPALPLQERRQRRRDGDAGLAPDAPVRHRGAGGGGCERKHRTGLRRGHRERRRSPEAAPSRGRCERRAEEERRVHRPHDLR